MGGAGRRSPGRRDPGFGGPSLDEVMTSDSNNSSSRKSGVLVVAMILAKRRGVI